MQAVPIPTKGPEEREARLLILAFDGTTNEFDDDNTNVVKVFNMLDKNRRDKQVLFYQTGIGTAPNPKFWIPGLKEISLMADVMVAHSLGEHVRDGYKWLQVQYQPGDKIALFGFSRGAYVARSLAAMIKRVGLAQTGSDSFVNLAWRLYKDQGKGAPKTAAKFKKAFSFEDIKIEYLGVFDSVSSVGCFIPKYLPFTANNDIVKRVAHAVSLDEARVQFQCERWNYGFDVDIVPPGYEREKKSARSETKVEEVWFAGTHVDCGGGMYKDSARYDLANIPLRWLIRDAERSGVGFIWNARGRKLLDDYDKQIRKRDHREGVDSGGQVLPAEAKVAAAAEDERGNPPPAPTLATSIIEQVSEEVHKEKVEELEVVELDRQDGMDDVHDPLIWQWKRDFFTSFSFLWTLLWFVLECLPLKKAYYHIAPGSNPPKMIVTYSSRPNFFRARHIETGPESYPMKVHRSVRYRMSHMDYTPKINLPEDTIWVE